MYHTFPPVLTLLLAAAPLVAQEKFTLRNEFQPGLVSWVSQTQDMSQSMAAGGKPMKTSFQTSMWLESKVVEAKDGVAAIEQRFARIKSLGSGPGMKVDYDSDVEGSKAGPMRALADLAGKTAKLRVDAQGKVQDFTLPDDLGEELERIGVSLKQGFEQAFCAWPTEPVAIGDSWESELEFPMAQLGSMKAKVANKLIAVKDKLVTVEQKVTMDVSGLTLPGTMTMEVTKSEGTSTFDLRLPMPVDGTMDLAMKMSAGENAPSVTIEMKSAIKQIEPPAPKAPAATPADAPKEAPKAETPKPGGK